MTKPVHTSVLTSGEPLRLIGEGDGEWIVSRHEIGEIVFAGLIVGDLLCGDYNPLTWPKGTPANQAKAYVVVAELAPDHERTCFLGLRFSDAPVVRWEASGVCCGVRAGVSGFVSADRVNVLDEDRALLEKCGPHLVRGTHLDLDGRGFVLSSSGWGDGTYDVYWGLAVDGTPAWVAIDFHILMGAIVEEHRLPFPLNHGTHRVADGIEIHVGQLSRWKPTLKRRLPKGESASLRVERPSGLVRAKSTVDKNKTTYDISPFKDATALVVRHITGYKPMGIAGEKAGQKSEEAPAGPVHVSVLTSGEPLRLSGDSGGEWALRRHEIGEFVFDGLVVGDLFCEDYNPLEWPTGTPPTKATAYTVLAEVGPEHDRTCFLGLRFSDAPVHRWELADVCCSVDAGVAGFVSADRVETLDEGLLDTCHDHDVLRGLHLDLEGRSFVLSSTGWGDGVYEVVWGLGADGIPVWVAVDFEILMGPITQEYALQLPLTEGKHVLVDGIEVRVGHSLLEPVLSLDLPEGQTAYLHMDGPDGRVQPRPSGFFSETEVTYDISSAKDATTLVVEHIIGHKPMDVVG